MERGAGSERHGAAAAAASGARRRMLVAARARQHPDGEHALEGGAADGEAGDDDADADFDDRPDLRAVVGEGDVGEVDLDHVGHAHDADDDVAVYRSEGVRKECSSGA